MIFIYVACFEETKKLENARARLVHMAIRDNIYYIGEQHSPLLRYEV